VNATAKQTAETLDPEELRDAAKRLLADRVERRAGWGKEGAPPDTRALEAEFAGLGWLLLTIPASYGGLGQDFLTLVPIYEEIGRSLSPVTIADTMTAVDVLTVADDSVARDVLERIVDGTARVAVGFAAFFDSASLALGLTTVRGATGATDLMLLPESVEGRVALVDLRGTGVAVKSAATWDRGRVFGDITLNDVKGRTLAIDVREATQIARAHADLAMAWDSIGAAEQALAEAVAYMCTRQQFGRPVGSFQALKHRAADLKVGLELARALARRASDLYAERAEGWNDCAGQARLLAVDSFRAIAEEAVQFHGGIGFTWEHDCHLFLKRALMNEMLGETPEQIRDRVAGGIFTRALARGV
jgi:alkylation response protein AidB-like acyl-CoA dehydrogenase